MCQSAMPFIGILMMAFIALGSRTANTQEEGAPPPQPPPNAVLTEEDVAKFEPMLTTFLGEEDPGKLREARVALLGAMDRYAESKKVSTPAADDAKWRDMLGRYHKAYFTKKRAFATGRLKTEMLTLDRNGEHFAIEYSIHVPKSYDGSKSWPVLLCLHDDGKKLGKNYLQKVWLTREHKDLVDKFILVAPHIPEKLLKKKIKIKVNNKSKRVETSPKRVKWFERYHLWSMVLPLYEVRKEYNCDPTRIFVEGVGKGGDAALTLAAMSPGRFAGVISRHGRFKDSELVAGLTGCPTLVIKRAGGRLDKGSGQEFWKSLEAAAQDGTMPGLVLEALPAPEGKLKMKDMAGQETDPVLVANSKVAAFIADNALEAYPKEVRVVSNHRAFRSHPLVKVVRHDILQGKLLDCQVRFDREKNRIELTGSAFYKVSFFLNDSILDLGKPVEILVNGKLVDARVPDRDPEHMLKSMKSGWLSPHQVFTSVLTTSSFTLEPEEKKEGEDAEKKEGGESGESGD